MEPLAIALLAGIGLCILAIIWVGFYPPKNLK